MTNLPVASRAVARTIGPATPAWVPVQSDWMQSCAIRLLSRSAVSLRAHTPSDEALTALRRPSSNGHWLLHVIPRPSLGVAP